MVPPQYAPLPHPQSTSTMEEAILNLTKLVGNFVEAQKTINAQLSQKIDTMENNVNKRIDGLQSEMEHKFDNLQCSISKLAQQHDHQEEENLEEECILGEQAQMQPQGELMQEPLEAPEELPTREAGGGRGKGAGEEHQRLTLHPIPINLNPSATAQPQNSPLPVYILPSPAAQPTPEAPTGKATPFATLVLQNIRKLVATVRTFATTSKTQATAGIAWHSGWFGCWFGFRALEPSHF